MTAMCWRPETGKKPGACGYVSYSVAVTLVSHGEFRGGHGDTVKELSHAAHDREVTVDGEPIGYSRKAERQSR